MNKIIVDTREQKPWMFENMTRTKLDTGDYSIEGYEDIFCIERKAHTGEFYRNIVEHRFEKELERMSVIRHGFVLLSFDMDDIMSFPRNSSIPPKIWPKLRMTGAYMRKRMLDFQLKYNTKILLCGAHGRDVAISLFKLISNE